MKRNILILFTEIILCIMFILVSIPLWKSFDLKVNALENNIIDKQDIIIYDLSSNLNKLIYLNGQCINNELLLYNPSNVLSNGKLILKISKLSEISYNILTIKIDGVISNLETLFIEENNNEYIFELENIILSKYESEQFNIEIDVKEDVIGNIFFNKMIFYNLLLV